MAITLVTAMPALAPDDSLFDAAVIVAVTVTRLALAVVEAGRNESEA